MNVRNSRIAVYPGSFDPLTLGHLDVIRRGSRLVDRLVVGIGLNTEKPPLFAPQQRVELVRLATRAFSNVEVLAFSGLAVDFVRQCGARVMVRGIRPMTDLAGEFTMMMANRQLDPGIETVFLMADERFTHVSSSLIKQITPLATDDMLAKFVPRQIIPALREKLAGPATGRAPRSGYRLTPAGRPRHA
jgi:pantetheine-phosphate adenylyltransferase